MAAILDQLKGYRLFPGELLNQIITVVNNLSGVGASGASQDLAFNGNFTGAPQLLTAAGATQGNATAITKSVAIVTVATTNSNHGVRLPTAVTGRMVWVACNASHGCKVYPATNGKIGAASTNAADGTLLLINKANLYIARNTTYWAVQRGA
jgi:hypothetical protein